MTTAIYIAALCIGGAINPEWIVADDGDYKSIATLVGIFAVYDLLTLIAKFKRK